MQVLLNSHVLLKSNITLTACHNSATDNTDCCTKIMDMPTATPSSTQPRPLRTEGIQNTDDTSSTLEPKVNQYSSKQGVGILAGTLAVVVICICIALSLIRVCYGRKHRTMSQQTLSIQPSLAVTTQRSMALTTM